jgi:hypothetical protein
MELKTKVQKIFAPLKSSSFPSAGIMKKELDKIIPRKGYKEVPINNDIIKLFASASVEMWLRAVHSFLISSSLTNVSHLWASISGYYASHYTVRAIAHLIGIYQLRTKRYTVILRPSKSGFVCQFSQKKNKEHSFYWHIVKSENLFINDDLFSENDESLNISDASHRNFATYIDHLNKFTAFNPLSLDALKQRIDFISKIKVSSYQIPNKEKYPDVEAVQIIAYHRLVYYRELIDEFLGTKNNFWNVHRNPNWCRDIINFQRIKPSLIETLGK